MTNRKLGPVFGLALAFAVVLGGACAHQGTIPETTVADTEENRAIWKTVEDYRQRLRDKNVEGLLVLASPKYFEDAGTPTAIDDYGYEGLKQILASRLARVRTPVRYDIQYRAITITGDKAEVEVYLSGAFEVLAENGERYRRISDFHRFVLERAPNNKWKFLSGM
jgi:hypothetical protein